MTLEEENVTLRAECTRLRFANRRHRQMAEEEESLNRELTRQLNQITELLKTLTKTAARGAVCTPCLKVLAQALLGLRRVPADADPSSPHD